MPKNLLGILATGFVVFFFAGCGPASKVPFITEPSTGHSSEVAEKWKVTHSGNVQIIQDKDGVVNIYGMPGHNNPCTVVVSGTATFKIHDVNVVYIKKGVTAECFSCPDVRAESGSTVSATNCHTVKAAAGAKVTARGTTTVNQEAAEPAPAK